MPKPIPLTTALRIKRNHIIIHTPRCLVHNLVLENLPSETRVTGLVERPVERDTHPVDDFFGRCSDCLRREQVQHPELVFGAEEAPCVSWGPGFVERERVEGGEVVFGVVGGHVGLRGVLASDWISSLGLEKGEREGEWK